MSTNDTEAVADDDKRVTEEDLRDLKYGNDEVETSNEADETSETDELEDDTSEEASEDDGQTDDQAEDDTSEETDTTESDEDESEFVKEFPNIKGDNLEDYTRNLEKAYQNSTTEALRLKSIIDNGGSSDASDDTSSGAAESKESIISDPTSLYMKQKMDEEINEAFNEFSRQFPQVQDPTEYNKFTNEVKILSQTILNGQKRLASPRELYSKAAVILGWEPTESTPTGKEKIGIAIKRNAGTSKTTSSTKKAPKSKVSDQMVAVNRAMYPNKTDAEIREELEPYVN